MPDGPRPRRTRFVVLIAALVLLLLTAAILPWFWIHAPRSDVEEVLIAHSEFVEAAIDGDYERIVDDLLYPGYPAWWTRDDLDSLAERCRKSDEKRPEERRAEIQRLRALRTRRVEVNRDLAEVVCDGSLWRGARYDSRTLPDIPELRFQYRRVNGEWRFCGIWYGMMFKTLERKVIADLPKKDWRAFSKDTIVTIGPEGLAEEGARLLTWRIRTLFPDSPETATVILDVAPTASWGTVVVAQDAIRQAGVENVRFAAASAAGPVSGVRVNGVPVAGSPSSVVSVRPLFAAVRVLTIGDRSGGPAEISLVCPNASTVEGVPWIIETSFTNHGARSVRAHRMGHADASVVLVLEPLKGTEGEATRIAATGDVPPKVAVGPNRRVARLDVIPWRPGTWTVRAEVLDPHGRRTVTPRQRLTTQGGSDPAETAEQSRARAAAWIGTDRFEDAWGERLADRGGAIARLVRATGGNQSPAIAVLGKIARDDKEPSLRLLAVIGALRLEVEAGRRLLRDLARAPGGHDGLAEAARLLIAND